MSTPRAPKHLLHDSTEEALPLELSQRAETASRSVHQIFGRKVAWIPGTLIGSPLVPDFRPRKERLINWHYWWQAHYLDCTIDAGMRALANTDTATAHQQLDRAASILRGISIHNLGNLTNSYYDDMAWLTLAVERLNRLSLALTGAGMTTAQEAGTQLYQQLTQAIDNKLGGGAYWSKTRDFKNTPANAPIAQAFVRANRHQEAVELLNWLHENLWNGEQKAYLDGIKILGGTSVLEAGIYSYNAGPVLSALLELPEHAAQALTFDRTNHLQEIISGALTHFCREIEVETGETIKVLATAGDGDGGLFSGILARNLALATESELIPAEVRANLTDLLLTTAQVLWDGRREFDPNLPLNEPGIDVREIRGESVAIFSTDLTRHSSETIRPGAPLELSNQLTAWMILEAAARLV